MTRALQDAYGDIDSIDALNKLRTLANESTFYVDYIDNTAVWQKVEKMTTKQLNDEVAKIADVLGIEL